MAKEISQQEIDNTKKLAAAKGLKIDWGKCTLRKSNQGNIICSMDDDIFPTTLFYINKKGKFIIQDMQTQYSCALGSAPAPSMKGLSKKQRRKLKQQEIAKIAHKLEYDIANAGMELMKELNCQMGPCLEISSVRPLVTVNEKEDYTAQVKIKALLKYDNRIIAYMNEILMPLADKDTVVENLDEGQIKDAVLQCMMQVYTKKTLGKFQPVQETMTDITLAVQKYIKKQKVLKLDASYSRLLKGKGLYDLYRRMNEPDILSLIEFNIKGVRMKDDTHLTFACCDGTFTYDVKTKQISSLSLAAYEKQKQFIQKHQTAIKSSQEVISNIQKEIMKNPGKRINRNGTSYTNIKLRPNALDITILFSDNIKRTLSLSDKSEYRFASSSITKWYRKTEEDIAAEEKRKIEQKKISLMALPIYGNLLAYHILEFVKRNETYITAAAMVKNLRGNAQTFNGTIYDTDGSGKYGMLTPEEINQVLKLLIRYELLKEHEYKGTYGRFYTLQLTQDGEMFLDISLSDDTNTAGSFKKFKDTNWLYYLKKVKKSGKEQKLTVQQEASQLTLLDHKNVIISYPELVRWFILTKPADWQEYVQTMYELTAGTEKKYWKTVKEMWADGESK